MVRDWGWRWRWWIIMLVSRQSVHGPGCAVNFFPPSCQCTLLSPLLPYPFSLSPSSSFAPTSLLLPSLVTHVLLLSSPSRPSRQCPFSFFPSVPLPPRPEPKSELESTARPTTPRRTRSRQRGYAYMPIFNTNTQAPVAVRVARSRR
ncbi:hypothetical protein GALMADRAFT_916840 [Galerina marginata CBS 339.88]|uniref:Secreted protein n=1 Tax=Galerina marginata (strain CBS 339.88) TaxID=685588 RepID=A0A067SHV9_GALM3|nr:hypothetical protein GALMADRAFT_916840 [Galerina marginata CBS 339.88]